MPIYRQPTATETCRWGDLRQWRSVATGLLLLAVLMVATGCTAWRFYNAESPTVAVANVSLAGFSFTEQEFDVALKVSNPNNYELPVEGLDYALRVDGETLANGSAKERFTLPANGSEIVNISVTGSLLENLGRLQRWHAAGRDTVAYDLTGDLKLAGVPVRLPFSHADTVALALP